MSTQGEQTLLTIRPHYFWRAPIDMSFGIMLQVGIVVTLLWMFKAVWGLCWLGLVVVRNFVDFLQYRSTRLTITDRRTVLRRGLFSKHLSEVSHRAVRQVVLQQSFLQRLFNVGYIGISSSASAEMEIEITGVREPGKIKALLNSLT